MLFQEQPDSPSAPDTTSLDQSDNKDMIAMDLSIDTKTEPKADVIPKTDFKPAKKSMVSENTASPLGKQCFSVFHKLDNIAASFCLKITNGFVCLIFAFLLLCSSLAKTKCF